MTGITPEMEIEKEKKDSRLSKTKIILIFLTLSLILNIFLIFKTSNGITGNSISDFKYTFPKNEMPLDSNNEGLGILHYQGLREDLEKKILEYGPTENVGVFLQDVKTGAWLGINERDYFIPASLFKVSVMIAILKKVDLGELKLTDKIEILPEDLNSESGELYKKGAGTKVQINSLLKEMITFSDNTAKSALSRQLNDEEIDGLFNHVGIAPYSESVYNRLVSPRGYLRLFKSLYYSTYLSPEMSEFALELTTDTKVESLIPKGVPYEIQVAHKFGYYNNRGQEGVHDCGIVYHPRNPYFLCIMTKDLGMQKSIELIPELSKEIFDYVDSH